jgi:abortive infection bacteriophage resistance protein
MGSKAVSIDEQISLLTSRGMNFDGFELEKIKEVLLDIGYYRLGFYWFDAQADKNEHIFVEGTQFKTILDLYYLDSDIRYILTKYLNRIEVNFRTNVTYYMSMKFKGDPIWFVSPSVMNSSFLANFPKHYTNDFIRKHLVIKKHHAKYPDDKYAPAWKTLENFPFGSVFKIYQSNLHDDIRERISLKLGIKPIVKFERVFNGLVQIRNRCAHGAILYNHSLPKSLPTIPDINYKDDNRSNLRVVVQVVLYVLGHISENRKEQFRSEINNCMSEAYKGSREAYLTFSSKSGLENI